MRSVILIGAGCGRELAESLSRLGIPVLTTWQGIDRIPEDSPVFCGRPGVIGQRAANIINQKAERLYVFGARLDHSQINYKYDTFAPRARKIVYDVDPAELAKFPPDWELHQVHILQLSPSTQDICVRQAELNSPVLPGTVQQDVFPAVIERVQELRRFVLMIEAHEAGFAVQGLPVAACIIPGAGYPRDPFRGGGVFNRNNGRFATLSAKVFIGVLLSPDKYRSGMAAM